MLSSRFNRDRFAPVMVRDSGLRVHNSHFGVYRAGAQHIGACPCCVALQDTPLPKRWQVSAITRDTSSCGDSDKKRRRTDDAPVLWCWRVLLLDMPVRQQLERRGRWQGFGTRGVYHVRCNGHQPDLLGTFIATPEILARLQARALTQSVATEPACMQQWLTSVDPQEPSGRCRVVHCTIQTEIAGINRWKTFSQGA